VRGGVTSFRKLTSDSETVHVSLLDVDEVCSSLSTLLRIEPRGSDIAMQALKESQFLHDLEWTRAPFEKRAVSLVLQSSERAHGSDSRPAAGEIQAALFPDEVGSALASRWEVFVRLLNRLLRNVGRDLLLDGRTLSGRTRNLAVQFFVEVRSLLDLGHAVAVKRSGLVKLKIDALLPVTFSQAAFQGKLSHYRGFEWEDAVACQKWAFSTADFLRFLPAALFDGKKIRASAAGLSYAAFLKAQPAGSFRQWLVRACGGDKDVLERMLPPDAIDPVHYNLRFLGGANKLVFTRGPTEAKVTDDEWLAALKASGILAPFSVSGDEVDENGDATGTRHRKCY
jgi:hypothetical protein